MTKAHGSIEQRIFSCAVRSIIILAVSVISILVFTFISPKISFANNEQYENDIHTCDIQHDRDDDRDDDNDGDDGGDDDDNDDCEEDNSTTAPHCGDGIINQSWEQCDGGTSCTDRCLTSLNQCTDLVLSRINISNVFNKDGGRGDATSDIFLGQGEKSIPQGSWFMLSSGGSPVIDPDVSGYEDVPGIAVQRLNKSVRVLLHGSQRMKDVEHVEGAMEIWNANFTGQANDTSGNNRLENGFDGIKKAKPGQDEVWLENGISYFWLTVNTQDDAFYTSYSGPQENFCPIPPPPPPPPANEKVTICHRTNSETNPYVVLEVDENAVDGEGENDHTKHEGDIIPITDRNGDNDIDADDCTFTLPPPPPTPAQCSDSLDNDGDGDVDFPADDGCFSPEDDDESDDPNSAPILDAVGNFSVNEGDTVLFDANASDADGDMLTYTVSFLPGDATLNSATGEFNWITAESDGPGTYEFDVTVLDGRGGSDTEHVTITVAELNTAPAVFDVEVSTHMNTARNIDLLASDSDIPVEILSLNLVSGFGPANGALGTISGRSVVYTPNDGFTGSDSFRYVATDEHGAVSLAEATVFINITNDAPVITKIADEHGAEITDEIIQTELVQLSLTAFASDPNGDPMTFSLGIHPNGASITSDGSFGWMPSEEQGPGNYPVTIIVTDGNASDSAAFTVTVVEANTAPTAFDGISSTVEDNATPLFGLMAEDPDLPPNTLTFFVASGQRPAHGFIEFAGNSVQYVPNKNFNGIDSFGFTVLDGHGGIDTGTVTVTVSPVNDPPVITLNPENPMNLTVGDEYIDPGATVTDPDLENPIQITSDDRPDTSNAGTYLIIYSYSDEEFTVIATRTVIVSDPGVQPAAAHACDDGFDNDGDGFLDFGNDSGCESVTDNDENSAPTIALNGTDTVELFTGGSYAEEGATAHDVEDGNQPAIVGGDTVDTSTSSAYFVRYNYTDTGGLAAPEVTRTVNVVESSATVTPPTSPLNSSSNGDTSVSESQAQPPVGGGGGNGSGNGSPYLIWQPIPASAPTGQVLGASITMPQERILGETCEEYINEYIKFGKNNNPEEVKKLQTFLVEEMGANLPITGFYGSLTRDAVNKFQVKYGKEVLRPWLAYGHSSEKEPTGYVYKTTKRWINMIKCPSLKIPMPPLP